MQGKKKSPFKRITSFEFSPSDPTRLMVTSADSQILHGVDVICKYRGKSDKLVESSQCKLPFSSPDNFSLDHGLFSHSMLRGSATWPEENLPASSSAVSSEMCRSQYKLLKMSCQSMHGVGMDDSNHSRTVAAYAIRTV